MRTRDRIVVLVVLSGAAWAQELGTISGVVRDSAYMAGIGGVDIVLIDQNDFKERRTQTDASGAYSFVAVPASQYQILAQRQGYSADATASNRRYRVTFVEGRFMIDPVLTAHATVRGRVLLPDGTPAVGAMVFATGNQPGSARATADAEGRFAIKDVSAETIRLRAIPPRVAASAAAKAGTPRAASDEVRIETVETYYPSEDSKDTAAPIHLQIGDANEGYEIKFRTARVASLRGVVTRPDGKSTGGIMVRLIPDPLRPTPQFIDGRFPFPMSLRSLTAPIQTQTRPDGSFEFASVPEGDWRVVAEALVAKGEDPILRGIALVRTSTRDVDGLVVALQGEFDLDASIEGAERGRPPAQIQLISQDWFAAIGTQYTQSSYKLLHLVPGYYTVSDHTGMLGSGQGRQPIQSVLVDGTEALGRVVHIDRNTSIRIVYGGNPGSIQGSVEASPGANVVLFGLDGEPAMPVRYIKAGDDGSFAFSSLRPGTYRVIALPAHLNLVTADVPTGLRERATSVRVTEGSEARIDLKVDAAAW